MTGRSVTSSLRHFVTVSSALAGARLASACGGDRAEHEVAVPWALGGAWLVADLHTHTKFSDGALTPQELVEKALANGCHALAITDHGDPGLKSATREYVAEIRRLRQKYGPLALIAGMEWNVPPYRGREHVTVLLDPALEELVLPAFRQRYDTLEPVTAPDALKWLQGQLKRPTDAVLIYNHPSRASLSLEQTLADFSLWRKTSALMTGFEGAPGHQRNPMVGSYTGRLRPEHRWDPVAARVGGVWDTLLEQGQNVWGALASSDYHNDGLDYLPCAFSRTFVQVPERSPSGVLKALHAGTYWGSHGRFLNELLFTASAPGLIVPASPGEVIRYRRGGQVRVNLTVGRAGEAGKGPLAAELIGNCSSGKPELLATLALGADQSAAETTVAGLARGADGQSCYLRLRVRKKAPDDDWLAYTNPIRIKLD